MIQFLNVEKAFRRTSVLRGTTFQVEHGITTGLVGRNGVGKTTIMRMIATLIRPDSGAVLIDGQNANHSAVLVRRKVGLVLGGESPLYERLSARENIMYFAHLQGMPRALAAERLARLAAEFDLERYLDRRVGGFSRGMRQKVSLLCGIIHQPRYLLLDEPSTGLDVEGIEELHHWIRHAAGTGITILVSSHNLNEVERLCHHVLIAASGRVSSHTTDELRVSHPGGFRGAVVDRVLADRS